MAGIDIKTIQSALPDSLKQKGIAKVKDLIMNKSQESDICDKKRMQLLDSDLCEEEAFGYFNTTIYPNPFDNTINIDFYLFANKPIKIEIFDILGKKVAYYENATALKGFFPLVFNFPDHAIRAGVYLIRTEVGEEKKIQKLIKL
jgi:hypothetical protein